MTHSNRSLELGLYGKDIIHNPNDKSFKPYVPSPEDAYQIIDFLNNEEVNFLRNFFYNYFDEKGVKLINKYFFITYPLRFPEINEIIKPKLNKLFDEYYSYDDINHDENEQSSDFFFWQKGIFAPHTDSIIHIPGFVPYKDILLPLEIDNDVMAPYYSCHQRWYKRGTHFQYGHITDTVGMYSNTFREHPYDYYGVENVTFDPEKMVNDDWFYDNFGGPNSGTQLPRSIFYGLSINKEFYWVPGSAIINDSSVIHGATNYTLKGGKFKLGITLRIFNRANDYEPDTLFSRYKPHPGFSACSSNEMKT